MIKRIHFPEFEMDLEIRYEPGWKMIDMSLSDTAHDKFDHGIAMNIEQCTILIGTLLRMRADLVETLASG